MDKIKKWTRLLLLSVGIIAMAFAIIGFVVSAVGIALDDNDLSLKAVQVANINLLIGSMLMMLATI